MLDQSSINLNFINRIGSFELAAWQETDDGALEDAAISRIAAPPMTQSPVTCPRIDDNILEQAAWLSSSAPSFQRQGCLRV